MLDFKVEQLSNNNISCISVGGAISGITFDSVSEPTVITSFLIDFFKQSEFVIKNAFYINWQNAGTLVTEMRIPFPSELYDPIVYGLLPTVVDSGPPINYDTDFCAPQKAAFYYNDTEFVDGTLVLGLRSGVPTFIFKSSAPVALKKITATVEWMKEIYRVFPA